MITKHFLTLIAIIIGGYVFFTVFFILQRLYFPTPILQQSEIQDSTKKHKEQSQLPIKEIQQQNQSLNTLLKVPFVSQAPSGNWDNPIFQNGCEEASIFMAMLWVEGKLTTPLEAEKAILAMSNFEQKNYGNFLDTSAQDTARLLKDYFGYKNVKVEYSISTEDIKDELAKGNLIIVPVNGRKLRNPFYTPPGPEHHMLVVRGYDAENKIFITNDPGTSRGGAFQYSEEVLEEALRDYPTGYHEPIEEVRKVMIVVGR